MGPALSLNLPFVRVPISRRKKGVNPVPLISFYNGQTYQELPTTLKQLGQQSMQGLNHVSNIDSMGNQVVHTTFGFASYYR